MNQLMIAGGILLAIGIGFLIIKLITHAAGGTKKPQPATVRNKIAYGKIIMWIVVVAVIAILGLITPKYVKKSWKEKTASKLATPSTFSWKKNDDQYGRYPEKRESGPKNAKITRDDKHKGGVFNFEVPYLHNGIQRVSYFEGEYVTDKRIEGNWSQDYPRAGGDWYLERNSANKRLFTGSHRDGVDWIPMTLKIKLK